MNIIQDILLSLTLAPRESVPVLGGTSEGETRFCCMAATLDKIERVVSLLELYFLVDSWKDSDACPRKRAFPATLQRTGFFRGSLDHQLLNTRWAWTDAKHLLPEFARRLFRSP